MFNIFKKRKKQKKFMRFNHRLLFIMRSCEHCKLYHGIVDEFNAFLPPEKRIRIIDVTESWAHNITLEPILDYIDLKGTPTLYLGGANPVVLEGVTTRSYLKGFLKGYLQRMGDL